MPDGKLNSDKRFVSFVESGLSGAAYGEAADRAVGSFLQSARRNGFYDATEDTLKIWIVEMLMNGLKAATCKRYFGSMHGLYRQWTGVKESPSDPFVAVAHEVWSAGFVSVPAEVGVNAGLIGRLLRKSRESSEWLTVSIILYLLYNVKATLTDAVMLKRLDNIIDCQQCVDIIESIHTAPNSRYVFPLHQGKKRTPQIVRELTEEMNATLRATGMTFSRPFSRESLTAIWIWIAASCGINVVDIRSVISDVPAEYAFLSLLAPQPLLPGRDVAIINRVAEQINDKTTRWFVMKLRQGRRPADVTALLEALDPQMMKEIDFYYPTRRIMRREGRRTIAEDVPYLPDLLFFRLRADKVGRLFRSIGEVAWCFRHTNSPDSPYCSISLREMAVFQRHIGALTPDVEMALVSTRRPVAVGDRVRITTGMLDGMEGVVQQIVDADGTVTFILRLSDTAAIRWSAVHVGEAFVEPAV